MSGRSFLLAARPFTDSTQMLVVGNRIQEEEQVTHNRIVNVDEFIWPHGITPPLHHARKRRFRKRVNRRVGLPCMSLCFAPSNARQTIESVEEEVERLLAADSLATNVKFGETPTRCVFRICLSH